MSIHDTLVRLVEELKLLGSTKSVKNAVRRDVEAQSFQKRVVLEEKLNRAEISRQTHRVKQTRKAWLKEELDLNKAIAAEKVQLPFSTFKVSNIKKVLMMKVLPEYHM